MNLSLPSSIRLLSVLRHPLAHHPLLPLIERDPVLLAEVNQTIRVHAYKVLGVVLLTLFLAAFPFVLYALAPPTGLGRVAFGAICVVMGLGSIAGIVLLDGLLSSARDHARTVIEDISRRHPQEAAAILDKGALSGLPGAGRAGAPARL
jgi:hypothetical protein